MSKISVSERSGRRVRKKIQFSGKKRSHQEKKIDHFFQKSDFEQCRIHYVDKMANDIMAIFYHYSSQMKTITVVSFVQRGDLHAQIHSMDALKPPHTNEPEPYQHKPIPKNPLTSCYFVAIAAATSSICTLL